jgi:hypothetical protein
MGRHAPTPREGDARSYASKVETTKDEGSYQDPARGKMLLSSYFEEHFARFELAPTTRAL